MYVPSLTIAFKFHSDITVVLTQGEPAIIGVANEMGAWLYLKKDGRKYRSFLFRFVIFFLQRSSAGEPLGARCVRDVGGERRSCGIHGTVAASGGTVV